jgi:pseudaminic acid cytidylyltransferase
LIIIIPARGGSKRIPEKNKKLFHGVPIIYQVIDNLKSICEISQIIVSTDDPEIESIAKNAGAEVPFIRPKNLSDDRTDTISVVKHALQQLDINKSEIIGCVYSTSVFLNRDLIRRIDQNVGLNPNVFTFLAKEYEHPIQRAFTMNENNQIALNFLNSSNDRTQDYEPFFHDAGQIYAAYSSVWQKEDQIIKGGSIALLDQSIMTVDIDNERDWMFAELALNLNKARGAKDE